jgi:hypothetical protein
MNYDGGAFREVWERSMHGAASHIWLLLWLVGWLLGWFTYPNTSKLKVRKILVFFTSLQL